MPTSIKKKTIINIFLKDLVIILIATPIIYVVDYYTEPILGGPNKLAAFAGLFAYLVIFTLLSYDRQVNGGRE